MVKLFAKMFKAHPGYTGGIIIGLGLILTEALSVQEHGRNTKKPAHSNGSEPALLFPETDQSALQILKNLNRSTM